MSKIAIGAAVVVGAVALGSSAWAWSMRSIETPNYTVMDASGPFEIRQYPAMVLASFNADGSRGDAVRKAFSPLANYIFAKERDDDKIAMTAPVTQLPGDQGWTVSFIMPAERTLADLPSPPGDILLVELQPRTVAAHRFSGRWTDQRFEDAASDLRVWLRERGVMASETTEFAYYNDPFTPPFLRRNEVLIELQP